MRLSQWICAMYRSSMYTRITELGGRRYLQLVQGHRGETGKVRIKVVANLGRLDKLSLTKLDPLINGLNRAVGRLENTASDITYDSSLGFGDVFALHELWKASCRSFSCFSYCSRIVTHFMRASKSVQSSISMTLPLTLSVVE
jgi:hypothetical protein